MMMRVKNKRQSLNDEIRFKTLELINDVFTFYNVRFVEKEITRKQEVIKPKHIVIYLLNEYTFLSLINISSFFYHSKDHTNVISSANKIRDFIEVDNTYKTEVNALLTSNSLLLLEINRLIKKENNINHNKK